MITPINISHTSDLKLPMAAKSYIDSDTQEYKNVDSWTRLSQIAYRVKRGADLLQYFLDDINSNSENPSYEGKAKKSISTYIDMLRCYGSNDKTNMPSEFISRNSFSKLFQLLTEEIHYRYYEYDYGNGMVECNYSKAYYDYDEIKLRCNQDNNRFIKYISTSDETLRNIEIDEDGIRKKNGWSFLTERLYNHPLWSNKKEEELTYPGDARFIRDFNDTVDPLYQYVVGVPPMPFSGNLLQAKVIIFTLNPGYIESVNKNKCLDMTNKQKEEILCQMRNALNLQGSGLYDHNESSRIQGDYYWQRALAKLAEEAYNKPSTELSHQIYDDMAFFQLIGYHSIKFKHRVNIMKMPSVIFTKMLVKYIATKTTTTLLILRSERIWKNIIGDELWNKLMLDGRIITKGHKGMSQAISRNNLKINNGFDKLVKILRPNVI